MRRSTFCASAVAAVALFAGPAQGQQISSPYDFVETSQGIRAFASYVLTDRGVIDTGPGSAMAFGAGYGIRVSGPFQVDAQVSWLPTSRRVYRTTSVSDSADPMAGLEQIGEADLSLLLLDASIRFDITGPRTWYGIQPYALLGAGGAFRASSDNAVEEELPAGNELRVRFRNGFTGHVGLGAEWHVAERFSLRAEARDVLWKLHVPAGFIEGDRLIASEEWVQTAHLSLGLAWRF